MILLDMILDPTRLKNYGTSQSRLFLLAVLLITVLHTAPSFSPVLVGSELEMPSPWPERYQKIETDGARKLVDRALEFGATRLGKPRLEPRRVQLRLSVPQKADASIRRGFRLLELSDAKSGLFTIYLSVRPEHVAFAGQLAHEAFHVFQPFLRDVYVEGLNTYLAERFLRLEGLPWKPWQKHFESHGDPLYGGSWAMIRELAEAVGEKQLCRMTRFRLSAGPAKTSVKPIQTRKDFLPPPPSRVEHVDIDRWLDSLDPEARQRARKIIAARYVSLEKLRRAGHSDYGFRRPK